MLEASLDYGDGDPYQAVFIQMRDGRIAREIAYWSKALSGTRLASAVDRADVGRVVKYAAFVSVIAFAACGRRGESASQSDSAFAAMQRRGQAVMGVDQYASAHVFEDLEDGGRIVLEADNPSDTAGIAAIRQHMRDIAVAFRAGDFAGPFRVHAQVVPGTAVMTARHTRITYEATDRPRGAEVRMRTADTAAVTAIHAFLAFQRSAHHAAGHEAMPGGGH